MHPVNCEIKNWDIFTSHPHSGWHFKWSTFSLWCLINVTSSNRHMTAFTAECSPQKVQSARLSVSGLLLGRFRPHSRWKSLVLDQSACARTHTHTLLTPRPGWSPLEPHNYWECIHCHRWWASERPTNPLHWKRGRELGEGGKRLCLYQLTCFMNTEHSKKDSRMNSVHIENIYRLQWVKHKGPAVRPVISRDE